MGEPALSAVVEKPRAQAAIGSLRSEGVYDDDRSVHEVGDDTVAIPVTDPPQQTAVLEVIEEAGEPRLRTLADHLSARGWSDEETAAAPSSWAVIGSVVLVTVADDVTDPEALGEALLAMHGEADTVLAREGISGTFREPSVRVIAGEGDTETVHREHGTTYAMDLDTVMFSPGNKAERARMGKTVDNDEAVLDMFAGIGYFTLPMARAGAHVTAIERNPDSFSYLVENVIRNEVQDRVETYRADCRAVIDGGEADETPFSFERIVMGYYEAHEFLDHALRVLEPGGTVHMHEATPEALVPDRPVDRLREAADRTDRTLTEWSVQQIKGYSEGVSHVVVDGIVE
jgi:tRNA wybutosine-synthesizing protein 2